MVVNINTERQSKRQDRKGFQSVLLEKVITMTA
jgi:hypothetical protein